MPVDPYKKKVSIRYRADDGNDYSIVTSRNHALAIAGTANGDGFPPLPTKWKPRLVHGLQINPGGRDRKCALVVYTPGAALFTGEQTTFTIPGLGDFERTGATGERRTIAAPDYDGSATPPNERVAIQYVSDDGNAYRLVTTRAHASAIGATAAGNAPSYPDIWTPRHYGLLNPDLSGTDQRGVIVEPSRTAGRWTANDAQVITINGVPYKITGRIDEDRPRGAPGFTG